MSGLCHRLSEWVTSPFSAVVYFQKHFVDDVANTVKRQKEQFDRHAREAQERAVQLHLDELEGKYLCCVCGRPGEAREDQEMVYDTFSLVTLPPPRTIVKGIRRLRELEDEEEARHQEEVARTGGGGSGHRSRPHQRTHSAGNCRSALEKERQRDRRRRRQALRSGKTPLASREDSSMYDGDNVDESGSETLSDTLSDTDRTRTNSGEDSDGGFDERRGQQPTRSTTVASVDFYGAAPTTGFKSGDDGVNWGENGAANDGAHGAGATTVAEEYPAMDPQLVPPLEIRNMMHKIQHAVLNGEARTKRRAVHVHKDKGLTKIEESEIDMYSSFFQRPVHGFLCHECYTSARKRLDTVTGQIQTILFKARHPFLRKVSAREVNALSSAGQLSSGLLASILELQRRWREQQQATAMRALRLRSQREKAMQEGLPLDAVASAFEDAEPNRAIAAVDESARLLPPPGTRHTGASRGPAATAAGLDPFREATAVMSDETITTLRSVVRCDVCQRRPCCYFNRVNVIFLCQFCTARDRFYRENAVCINDELLPAETVHLLTDLARYHEGVHRAQELRQLPQTELDAAQTDLFGLHESLFCIQDIPRSLLPPGRMTLEEARKHELAPQGKKNAQQGDKEGGAAEDGSSRYLPLKVEARPYASIEEMRRREMDPREVVGRTQLSLFEDTRVEPVAALMLSSQNREQLPRTTGTACDAATTATRGDVSARDDLFASPAAANIGKVTDVDELFAPTPPLPQQALQPQQELMRDGAFSRSGPPSVPHTCTRATDAPDVTSAPMAMGADAEPHIRSESAQRGDEEPPCSASGPEREAGEEREEGIDFSNGRYTNSTWI